MRKLLIIGGTGTMGAPLVSKLCEPSNELHIVCRHHVTSNKENVYYHSGDVKDVDFLKSILTNKYDAIVDFCWYDAEEFKIVYHYLLKSTSHYVCLSSAAVYADITDPKNEDSPRYMETDPPLAGEDKYHLYCYEKARIEDMLRSSEYKNWTIIRPGITLNRNHFFWGCWIDETFTSRILLGQPITIPEDLLQYRVSLTYGGDVADMIIGIINNPNNSLGEIYNVTSLNDYSWAELLEVYRGIFNNLGVSIKEKRLESCKVFIRSKSDEYLFSRIKLLDRRFDNTKIYDLCGTISTPIEPLLREWCEDYKRNFPKRRIRTQNIEKIAKLDRLTKVSTPRWCFKSNVDYFCYLIERYIPKGIGMVYIVKKHLGLIS